MQAASTSFRCYPTFEDFIRGTRGSSDLHEDVRFLSHPAAELLHEYSTEGVPCVTNTEGWTPERVLTALEQGAHKSAYEYLEFVREEFADFVK